MRNQDDEFNFRLTQSGGKIWFAPSLKTLYYGWANFGKLWRQYSQYGLYKVRVTQKRRAVASWRHLVPAGFVLGLISAVLLALITHDPIWVWPIAGPYLIANIAAGIWTARRDWQTLPLLPMAFGIRTLPMVAGFRGASGAGSNVG